MRLPLIFLLLPLAATAQEAPWAGSKACAACHPAIYRRYMATGMAKTSGAVGGSVFRESFAHAAFSDAASGASYRVSPALGGYRLEFSRDATIAGERLLKWFVGSGHTGRSYLFSLDGFLFQSPVSYYSAAARWDVSPGYQRSSSINLTRPVEPRCLQCHASRLDRVAGTENGFRAPPFLEGGIGCERCHGPGRDHVARMSSRTGGSGGIVNPARLAPARRDSVCAQCHLTGAARVARLRPRHDVYQPGGSLAEYSAFFVWAGSDLPAMKVASHFERLQQSRCKKASGDRLWCGTCHDPHGEPEPAVRAAYYRARCEQCHRSADCKAPAPMRAAAQDNCIACHMPKSPVIDAQHAVYTDHSIPRRPRVATQSPSASGTLVAFWKTPADQRDLALAYASVAGDDARLCQRATALLRQAELHNPQDAPVLAQLAQLDDAGGDTAGAAALYERVLRSDPANTAAAVNLGTIRMQQNRAPEAMRLWEDALSRNPALTTARVNLAVAQFRSGQAGAAETSLQKALDYDPDQPTARRLLAAIRARAR